MSVLWPAVARSIEIPVHHLPLYSCSYLHTPEWKTGEPGTHDSSSLWQSILWLLAAGVFPKIAISVGFISPFFFITAKFKFWILKNKWFGSFQLTEVGVGLGKYIEGWLKVIVNYMWFSCVLTYRRMIKDYSKLSFILISWGVSQVLTSFFSNENGSSPK